MQVLEELFFIIIIMLKDAFFVFISEYVTNGSAFFSFSDKYLK